MSELETVVMPARIAKLPRTENGYPRPFMTSPADIRIVDPRRIMLCAARKLCGICGERLGYWLVFASGPKGIEHRISTDAPFHEECAHYAMRVCPFIARPRAKRGKEYRVEVTDDAITDPDRPEKYGLAFCRSFEFGWLTPNTMGFHYSQPVKIEWWKDGQQLRSEDQSRA